MKTSKRLVFALFATTVLTASAAAFAADSVASLLDKGRAALAAGKAERACRSFEKADGLAGGQSYAAHLGFASACATPAKLPQALAAAAAAERLGQDARERAAAAFLEGLVHYRLDPRGAASLAAAKTALERAIALDPEGALPARLTLAQVEIAAGEQVEAIAGLRETLSWLAPGHPKRTVARRLLCSLLTDQPSHAANVEAALQPDDRIQKPVGLYQPPPPYSREARGNRIRGHVVYQGIVDRDGCIRDLKNLRADDPELDRISRNTLSRWVFEPATLQGEPVAVWYSLDVNFRLN